MYRPTSGPGSSVGIDILYLFSYSLSRKFKFDI